MDQAARLGRDSLSVNFFVVLMFFIVVEFLQLSPSYENRLPDVFSVYYPLFLYLQTAIAMAWFIRLPF